MLNLLQLIFAKHKDFSTNNKFIFAKIARGDIGNKRFNGCKLYLEYLHKNKKRAYFASCENNAAKKMKKQT